MVQRKALLNHRLKTVASLKAYSNKVFTLIEIFQRVNATVTVDLHNTRCMNKQNQRIAINYWQF